MYDLHWLTVTQRIEFKIIAMTFKTIHDLAPKYLEELVERKQNSRSLRSSYNHHVLKTPRYSTKAYGYRQFSVAAPMLWNQLPDSIRAYTEYSIFKKLLKTRLFRLSYDI